MAAIPYLLKINGISMPKIKKYTVQRNKLYSEAGRSLSGELRATLIGIFPKILIEVAPTTRDEMRLWINALEAESFNLSWWDERTQTIKTSSYYSNNYDYDLIKVNGAGLYDSFSVNLIPYRKI